MSIYRISWIKSVLFIICALVLSACNSANPDSLGVINRPAPLPAAQVPNAGQFVSSADNDVDGNTGAAAGTQTALLADSSSQDRGEEEEETPDSPLLPSSNQGQQFASASPNDAVSAAPANVHIAPIIGATVATVRPLSRQMQALARTNNISIQRSTSGAQYILRGYFSALAENDQTTVIYVWDVVDGSGRRLHRISGQEKRAGGKPDAWSGVTPDMMENVANKTIENFQNWRLRRSG